MCPPYPRFHEWVAAADEVSEHWLPANVRERDTLFWDRIVPGEYARVYDIAWDPYKQKLRFAYERVPWNRMTLRRWKRKQPDIIVHMKEKARTWRAGDRGNLYAVIKGVLQDIKSESVRRYFVQWGQTLSRTISDFVHKGAFYPSAEDFDRVSIYEELLCAEALREAILIRNNQPPPIRVDMYLYDPSDDLCYPLGQ